MRQRWDDDVRRVAALLSRDQPGAASQIVLFTACARRAGTTTVIWKAAEILQAVYARKVLIIELNTRRPRLARLLGLAPKRGLLRLTDERTCAADQLQLGPSGVTILALGPGAEPGQIRPDVRRLLERAVAELAPNFDLILVDAPPLTEDADALASARMAGKVIVVFRAGRTSAQSLSRLSSELAQTDGTSPELVIVLNRFRPIIPRWIDKWLSQ